MSEQYLVLKFLQKPLNLNYVIIVLNNILLKKLTFVKFDSYKQKIHVIIFYLQTIVHMAETNNFKMENICTTCLVCLYVKNNHIFKSCTVFFSKLVNNF